MSTYTAGPKIDIDGDLSCRPTMSHYRGSGRCKNPADSFQRGSILFYFFVSIPIFHKDLFIFSPIISYAQTVKIYKPTDIKIFIKQKISDVHITMCQNTIIRQRFWHRFFRCSFQRNTKTFCIWYFMNIN